ncbi:MAG: dihydrofolate reductase family protein [Dehalococcoidales bacterium]|nr:dihydrofolate reductase family protein [Dehalococcoidales bacterium]
MSNSLDIVPEDLAGKAEIIRGDVLELVKLLNDRGYMNLYVDGGKTVQSFLEADLVDEITITRVPNLLGDDIPLFDKLTRNQKFVHAGTEIINQAMFKSRYIRSRD